MLVNPTRYLGNLLIAGELIQQFSRYCSDKGIQLQIVLDESFRDLLIHSLPEAQLVFYPRRAIARASIAGKLRLYLQCLRKIRNFRADIAFNIEEDSVSHRLTQLSGARFRLGCSTTRHRYGYHQVLPIDFSRRPADQKHRWYSFAEVFMHLGLEPGKPGYIHLHPATMNETATSRMLAAGLKDHTPLAVIHAGATKAYKRWPTLSFSALAEQLIDKGYQVAFIGSGDDCRITAEILEMLSAEYKSCTVNACGILSLSELAAFLQQASIMIGNDSGPFHLAAALNIPGIVIFGPTEADIWKPLGRNIRVIQHRNLCSLQCTRKNCLHAYRCLHAISPDEIMAALSTIAP